jgi:hypothetical protein
MKSGLSWIVVVLLIAVIGVLIWMLYASPVSAPTDINATSTPSTQNGTGGTGALHERVVVTAPESGQRVFENFTVTGEAPGNWFFEASFPIKVLDENGNTLVTVVATALTDWMTTEQVPFKAEVSIDGYTGPATLVLLRDNPSGLPENDDALEVEIVIEATQ